jgi:hypothetical protein
MPLNEKLATNAARKRKGAPESIRRAFGFLRG